MTDADKSKSSLAQLQNDLEEFFRALPGDETAHRQTADMLRKKGLSDADIREFLKGNL